MKYYVCKASYRAQGKTFPSPTYRNPDTEGNPFQAFQ